MEEKNLGPCLVEREGFVVGSRMISSVGGFGKRGEGRVNLWLQIGAGIALGIGNR